MGQSGRGDELPSWARRHLDEHDEQSELVSSAPVPGPRRRHRARRSGADRMRGWGLAAVAIAAAAGVVPLAVTSLTDNRSEVRIPVVDTFPAVVPAALPPEQTRLVPAPPRVSLVPAPEAPAVAVPADTPRAAVPAVAPGSRGVSRATVVTTEPAVVPTADAAPPTTVTVVPPPPTPREGTGSPTQTTQPSGTQGDDDQDGDDQDGDDQRGGQGSQGLVPDLVNTLGGTVGSVLH